MNLDRIEQDANDLIVFADGAEEAGMVMYAQKARSLARDTIRIVGELRTERHLRQRMQADRDRVLKAHLDAMLERQSRAA